MIALFSGLITLSIVIIIHEYGHYYVARYVGVKVEEFSLGMGWKIYQYSDRLGTKWSVRLLPLGGYVKLHGHGYTILKAPEFGEHFAAKTVKERLAIVLAGPIANFLLALLIIWVLICYHDFTTNHKHWWQYGWGIIVNFLVALAEVNRIIGLIIGSVLDIFASDSALKDLGSIIAIANISAAEMAEGIIAYAGFVAVLSINLGVLNLLPIPLLDGGQALLLCYETIAKKPLNTKIQEFLYRVGGGILLFLIVISFSNDIKNALT